MGPRDGIAEFYCWAPSVEDAKAALHKEFPAWSIIYTDRGRWWAIRRPVRSRWPSCGTSDVIADTAAELAERLRVLADEGDAPGGSGDAAAGRSLLGG
jgi:hypothetical protein